MELSFTFSLLAFQLKHFKKSLKKVSINLLRHPYLVVFSLKKMRSLIATFYAHSKHQKLFCLFKNAKTRAVCKLFWRQHVCVVIICRLRILFNFSVYDRSASFCWYIIWETTDHFSFSTARLLVTKAIYCKDF